MRGLYGFIVSAALLTGCASPDLKTGSGGLTLSEKTSRIYQQIYQELDDPGFFVVSADGSFSEITYCDLGPGKCEVDLIVERAIGLCEKRAGTECYLLAQGAEQIWDGSVKVRVPEYIPPPPPPAPASSTTASSTSGGIIPEASPVETVTAAAPVEGSFNGLSDLAICMITLSDNGNWTNRSGAARLISEAQRREMSPITCQNKIINNAVEYVEAVPVPQRHIDFYVCRMAAYERKYTTLGQNNSSATPFMNAVSDLGISTCAEILRDIESAPDAGHTYISKLPDEAICELAIVGKNPFFSIELTPYMSVAAMRGLTPANCG